MLVPASFLLANLFVLCDLDAPRLVLLCLMFHVVYVAERRRLTSLILLRTRGGRM